MIKDDVKDTKFVIVLGTVLSGLGKGILVGSLARIFQNKGYSVAPIKLEGYLNIDAGTLNPTRHGEVFVLDDGTEVDMDLGGYERMLDINLTSKNFTTTGQIMTTVLDKERSGDYLGRDVQIIPHVTDEIKRRLRAVAEHDDPDIVFVEIGGTVGDLENAAYLEACRQLAIEESGNVCFVALTYVPYPSILGEQKSKPAQIGLRQLTSLGIMPDIVAVRSAKKMSDTVKEKLALFSGVPIDSVFGMHDVHSASLVPGMIQDADLDKSVLRILNLDQHKLNNPYSSSLQPGRTDHYAFKLQCAINSTNKVKIGIAGKYTSLRDSYASIIHAIEHSAVSCGVSASIEWLDTKIIESYDDASAMIRDTGIDAMIIPGGFGLIGTDGKIACIQNAREHDIPFLGLCYGFQLAVIEFARHKCGLSNATSGEINKNSQHRIIDTLLDQSNMMGGTMKLGGHNIRLLQNTMVSSLYQGRPVCRQRFRHRYELIPQYTQILEDNGMVFSGVGHGDNTIKQILELPDHPFYLATQGHPEFTSRPLSPDPIFLGFMKAICKIHG